MTHCDLALIDDGDREHAGDAMPIISALSGIEDRIIGEGDGLANPLLDGADGAFETADEAGFGDSGSFLAGVCPPMPSTTK